MALSRGVVCVLSLLRPAHGRVPFPPRRIFSSTTSSSSRPRQHHRHRLHRPSSRKRCSQVRLVLVEASSERRESAGAPTSIPSTDGASGGGQAACLSGRRCPAAACCMVTTSLGGGCRTAIRSPSSGRIATPTDARCRVPTAAGTTGSATRWATPSASVRARTSRTAGSPRDVQCQSSMVAPSRLGSAAARCCCGATPSQVDGLIDCSNNSPGDHGSAKAEHHPAASPHNAPTAQGSSTFRCCSPWAAP